MKTNICKWSFFTLPKRIASLIYRGLALQGSSHKGGESVKRVSKGGVDMDDVGMLQGSEPRKVLERVIEKNVPAIMSYLSKGKWHVAKVQAVELGACRVSLRIIPAQRPHPINIQIEQPVGISIKYGYGKFVFETKVVDLEPSPESEAGGRIVLNIPDKIEIVQRRSYFRVEVPASLKVATLIWHRRKQDEMNTQSSGTTAKNTDSSQNYWQGKLIDISAGGALIALNAKDAENFKTGQFIGLRFTALPYERPLVLNAQIRNNLPTADGKSHCLGLQIVGLEASDEGRETLKRLCNVVERYYQMNSSGVKQQDFQNTSNSI